MEIRISIVTKSGAFPNIEERNAGFLVEEILREQFNAELVASGAGLGVIDLVFDFEANDLTIDAIQDALKDFSQDIRVELPDTSALDQIFVQEGDLFGVLVDNGVAVVGIVLHVSTLLPDTVMLGFYDRTFTGIDTVELSQLNNFVGMPFYVVKSIVAAPGWHSIGHSQELLQSAEIPKFRFSFSVYYKDEIVERLSSVHEFDRYPQKPIKSHQEVWQFLKKHFSGSRNS